MSRLGLKKPSKDKECVKVNYEIIIKIAENVPVTGPVYVQWKRGKKNENKGESKHVAVKDKKAIFEELLEISSTLYKIPKKGYEAKNISITLKEEKGKKGTSIAKTVIDLAEFAGKDEKRSFSLKSKKSKVAPTLTLHFKSKERALAPDEDVTDSEMITEDAASDDEDDVEDFTDDRDDSSTKSGKSTSSATSSSTPATPSKIDKLAEKPPSTPETKPRELSKRDSVNVNALDVEQLRAELERAKKRTKELATENVDYEDKVKELTKELEDAKKSKASPGGLSAEKEADLRKKIKDLTQENSDQAEEIKKLKKANEEKAATVASPGASEKEAQMKQRLKELATENVDLEEQVNSLKKELEAAKSSPSAKKSDKDDGSQKQVQELNERIKERDSTILSHKQELDERTKERDSALSHKQELDERIKERDSTILSHKQELAALKQTHDDNIKAKDAAILALKQELDNLKKGGDAKPIEKELNERIKERDNTILSQKQELEALKKSNVDAVAGKR